MSRTWRSHWRDVFIFPLFVIGVDDTQGNRRAGRFPFENPALDDGLIFFELHPRTGAIAALTPLKFMVDHIGGNFQPGRHSFKYGEHGGAMGFSRS